MDAHELRRAQGGRLAHARLEAGFRSAREAALECGWPESTYRAHENGGRTIGLDDAEKYAKRYRNISAQQILFGEEEPEEFARVGDTRAAPVMGYIGAGAEIQPDFEQVPLEGLFTVELPFSIPEDTIAFEVRGDSMAPRYDEGDVIICYRDQHRPTNSFYGEEAAVRTADGRRFLKTIEKGARSRSFNLVSFNARTIESVRLEWVGEIWVTVRRGQVRKVAQDQRAAARRNERAKRAATAGMEELPFTPSGA